MGIGLGLLWHLTGSNVSAALTCSHIACMTHHATHARSTALSPCDRLAVASVVHCCSCGQQQELLLATHVHLDIMSNFSEQYTFMTIDDPQPPTPHSSRPETPVVPLPAAAKRKERAK